MYTDQNYAFAAANMCIGIQRYCSDWIDDIIIFNEGLEEATKNNIASLYKSVIFKEYTGGGFYNKINMLDVDSTFIKKWTHGVFAKLECFDLLDIYNNAIWLDVDMLIQKNFRSVLDFSPLAWRTCKPYRLEDKLSKSLFDGEITTTAPNGGFLLFSSELKKYEITSKYAYTVLSEVIKSAPNSFDEIVMSLIALRKKIPVILLDDMYNCYPAHKDATNAYIIHAGGKDKFWNNKIMGTVFNEWHVNNKIWNNICGKEASQVTYSYRQIKEFFDTKDDMEKAVQNGMARFEQQLNHIDKKITHIEKGVFPFKRFVYNLKKLWHRMVKK